MATVAFSIHKCCNNVAILTRCWFSIFLYVLFASLTNAGCATFAFLLEFTTTIGAFHHRK